MAATLALTEDVVTPLIRGRFAVPYLWHESCRSTQDVLRGSGLPEGAVAVAEHQTAGRGRSGRRWDDRPGSAVLVSVLLRPPLGAPLPQLSLVAGLAAADAVEARDRPPGRDQVAERRPARRAQGGGDPARERRGRRRLRDRRQRRPGGRASSLPTPAARRVAAHRRPGSTFDRATVLASLLDALERRYDAWRHDGLEPLLPALEAATRSAAVGRESVPSRAWSAARRRSHRARARAWFGRATAARPRGRERAAGADRHRRARAALVETVRPGVSRGGSGLAPRCVRRSGASGVWRRARDRRREPDADGQTERLGRAHRAPRRRRGAPMPTSTRSPRARASASRSSAGAVDVDERGQLRVGPSGASTGAASLVELDRDARAREGAQPRSPPSSSASTAPAPRAGRPRQRVAVGRAQRDGGLRSGMRLEGAEHAP